MKECWDCHVIKPYSEFVPRKKGSKDGCMAYCRECFRKRWLKYRHENIDKVRVAQAKKRRKKYRENKEEILEANRQWRLRNPEQWLETRREAGRKWKKKERQTNGYYRMVSNQRSRLHRLLKSKSKRTLEFIGCSPAKLKSHIEKQFTEGMSWDNYGEWHVDHIVPCSSFDLSKEEDQLKCFHYTNLQPLWAKENLTKSGPRKKKSLKPV